ncbi:MAG: DUF2845 domain-containing protein [Thermodesulfobacteriota bacterium]
MSMWKTIVAFAIVSLLLGSPSPSAGDTFRCGSNLVSVGDTMGKVVLTCGNPSWKDSVGYSGGLQEIQIWYYNCGTDDFLYALHFLGGRLQRIESQGYGSGRSDCRGPGDG